MATLASTADTRNEVLRLATEVHAAALAPPRETMTARQAARVLTGIAAWITQRSRGGAEQMRHAFYTLAAHDKAWTSEFKHLPNAGGVVDEHVVLLAVLCSSMIPDFGLRNVRSAVAFWATETDPSVWMDVAAA